MAKKNFFMKKLDLDVSHFSSRKLSRKQTRVLELHFPLSALYHHSLPLGLFETLQVSPPPVHVRPHLIVSALFVAAQPRDGLKVKLAFYSS